VFCHNDLGQHNIIVDPKNLKILAIVDWEFAGFFPYWFEAQYWRRKGPSCAIGNEEDNADRLRAWLVEKCEEVCCKLYVTNEQSNY
jgi:thiamine kinase-like enzyme